VSSPSVEIDLMEQGDGVYGVYGSTLSSPADFPLLVYSQFTV